MNVTLVLTVLTQLVRTNVSAEKATRVTGKCVTM